MSSFTLGATAATARGAHQARLAISGENAELAVDGNVVLSCSTANIFAFAVRAPRRPGREWKQVAEGLGLVLGPGEVPPHTHEANLAKAVLLVAALIEPAAMRGDFSSIVDYLDDRIIPNHKGQAGAVTYLYTIVDDRSPESGELYQQGLLGRLDLALNGQTAAFLFKPLVTPVRRVGQLNRRAEKHWEGLARRMSVLARSIGSHAP